MSALLKPYRSRNLVWAIGIISNLGIDQIPAPPVKPRENILVYTRIPHETSKTPRIPKKPIHNFVFHVSERLYCASLSVIA